MLYSIDFNFIPKQRLFEPFNIQFEIEGEKMGELTTEELSLWGKKAIRDDQELWLPLVIHLIDAKNVINWLYNHWLTDNQRSLLMIENSETLTQNVVKFLGYIHDIGKATTAFQTKQSYAHNDSLDEDIMEKMIRGGFKGIDKLSFLKRSASPHALAGEALLEVYGVNKSIAAIIGGHHGKPLSNPVAKDTQYNSENYWPETPGEEQNRWKKVQEDLFQYGLHLCGFHTSSEIPWVNKIQAVLLEGLLIMADWLASSEYLNDDPSKPLFPLIDINESAADVNTEERYQNAINTWQITDEWSAERVSDIDEYYVRHWGFHPREVQLAMCQEISKALDPGMMIVEAPMGIGKTEIALTVAEQLASRCGCNGLFMGLPTQATSNAMFDRVEDWLAKEAKEQDANLSIKLIHGKAKFNQRNQATPRAENVQGSGAVVVNEWFTGKKSILEEFTVGTIDNLLQMGLKQRHLFLKHLGLSGKVVVIDEVHGYDVYMSSYLAKVLQWLGAYNVPVIALSATLPKEKRNELLKSYAKGKFGSDQFEAEPGWENNEAYPLLSMLDGKHLKQVTNFVPQKSKYVQVKRINVENDKLVDIVNAKIKDGGVAGIIVNTVKRAEEIADLMPKDILTIILHSAFLAPDRQKIEEKLQSMIGKNAARPPRLVVIGTQVLEQSLDIDLDVLFTDIAPMDLILQRVGRLHRHNIKRPKGLQTPQLYILGINDYGDYGKSNEYIYEKYLLMKTDHFLKDKIALPDDISKLVQQVYDTATDSEVSGLKEARAKFDKDQKKSKNKAKVFQIAEPKQHKRRGTIHKWLDWDLPDDRQGEIKAQAAVRDIQETLEVILLKEIDHQFYLLDGRKLAEVDDKTISDQVIRLPSVVTPEWKLDTIIKKLEDITAKNLPQWQQSIWLHDSLALILGSKQTTDFFDFRLSYSSDKGLCYERLEEKHG